MALHSLGKVTVPSPGTAVQCTVNQASPSTRLACHAVMIQALPANTGKIYVGLVGLNKGTLAQCIAILAVPTVNTIPAYSATLSYAPGGLNVVDFYIDSDQANDGVLVAFVAG
jgi:hypothetical protein